MFFRQNDWSKTTYVTNVARFFVKMRFFLSVISFVRYFNWQCCSYWLKISPISIFNTLAIQMTWTRHLYQKLPDFQRFISDTLFQLKFCSKQLARQSKKVNNSFWSIWYLIKVIVNTNTQLYYSLFNKTWKEKTFFFENMIHNFWYYLKI